MTTVELVLQLPLALLTIALHELLHYLVAYLLGYKPKFGWERKLIPFVSFPNKNRDIDNLLIALAAPVGLFVIGMLIPRSIAFLSLVRIICLLNILHVFPWCTDGQVILLSLIHCCQRGGRV
ncbi:TPA: DUF3267 domain-containing protein [Streptococcus equi subsp. zooepidemicus]|nr:DUF3267 domain-containing protein [Streptococcus equi subsp. zooepidemicus]HEL0604710.1 DUF3267 domain-containing protein [Streptococcus equi subsp. zooepidemicus]